MKTQIVHYEQIGKWVYFVTLQLGYTVMARLLDPHYFAAPSLDLKYVNNSAPTTAINTPSRFMNDISTPK